MDTSGVGQGQDAQRTKELDLERARDSGKWDAAVAVVREELEEHPDVVDRLRTESFLEPRSWYARYHFFGGMRLRNTLRDAGFGEDALGIVNLDNVYVEILEEALGVAGQERRVLCVRPIGEDVDVWYFPDGSGFAALYALLTDMPDTAFRIELGDVMTREGYDGLTASPVGWDSR